MRIYERNWMQMEEYLERDDRIVLPLGSTEQHAYLSLGTDSILAERVAVEAAEPLGVPVLPAQPFGLAPSFAAYPGSPSLRVETLCALVRDLLDSLGRQGFRRILVVNGHGGNMAAAAVCREWTASGAGRALFHNWWIGPRTWTVVQEIDPVGAHASWIESFPWTRLESAESPEAAKAPVELARLAAADAEETRRLIGDGSFGGRYRRSDEDMERVWQAGVEEVRALLEDGWA
jgi:creatinine amidohydrolase